MKQFIQFFQVRFAGCGIGLILILLFSHRATGGGDSYLAKVGPSKVRILPGPVSSLPPLLRVEGPSNADRSMQSPPLSNPLVPPSGNPADADAATTENATEPLESPQFIGPQAPSESASVATLSAVPPEDNSPLSNSVPATVISLESEVLTVSSGSKNVTPAFLPASGASLPGSSITAQALVRFFQRDLTGPGPLPESQPETLRNGIRSETDILLPVRFIPPEPVGSVPSSAAAYSTTSK